MHFTLVCLVFFLCWFFGRKTSIFLVLRTSDRRRITVRTALFKVRRWEGLELPASACRQKYVVAAKKKRPKIMKKYRTYGILKEIQRNSTQKYRTYGKFNVIRKKYRTYGIFCSIGTKKKCPKTAFFGNFGSFSGKILPTKNSLLVRILRFL